MAVSYVPVFLPAVQQQALAPPFRTVTTSLHSFPASQPTACPGRLDHRPDHIVAETHLLFTGHSAIDASDTSARRAWSECRPANPKGHIETEPRDPSQLRGSEECVGSHESHRPNYESSLFVMI